MNSWASSDFLVVSGKYRSKFLGDPPKGAKRVDSPEFNRLGIDIFIHATAKWAEGGITLGDWPDAPGCRVETSEGTVDLLSDTEGVKHLFYAIRDDCIAGTRIEDLRGAMDPAMDSDCFDEMLAIGYPLADRTPFEGIRRVDPDSRVRFSQRDGGMTFASSSPLGTRIGDDPEEALESLAARTAKICDEGAMIELSGGFDSRLVLALAMHGGASQIRAFTLGTPEEADSVSAQMVAKASGIDHQLIAHPAAPSLDALEEHGQTMTMAGGYQLNFSEYATFPLIFNILEGQRTAQVNGLGGELYTGSFDTPGDELASKFEWTRRLWLQKRIINSSNMFNLLWMRSEAKDRLAGVIDRLDAEVRRYSQDEWRGKMRDYYRLTKMRNWGGAVTSASSRWYSPHSPLWSRDFRAWSLGSPENSERSGQRALTNRLVPAFEKIAYQKELERLPEFRSQMFHRSNSVSGKIMLRLLGRRWNSGAAINSTRLVQESTLFQSCCTRLRMTDALGNPDFTRIRGLRTAQISHPVGVAMATFFASNLE